jgi:hypothetical protein
VANQTSATSNAIAATASTNFHLRHRKYRTEWIASRKSAERSVRSVCLIGVANGSTLNPCNSRKDAIGHERQPRTSHSRSV